MSFSADLKNEIMRAQYKNSCCRRALLQGILSAKGYLNDVGNIAINIENEQLAELPMALIREIYGSDATLAAPPRGGRCKQISFTSKAQSKFISSIEAGVELFSCKCPLCSSSFFRGVFFASGRMTDPEKQFCLEFSLGNRINLFLDLFLEHGFDMKISNRRAERILYSKNSTVIEDFLAYVSLHDAAFSVMNQKIANALKNDANRMRNFDTVNISKAVDAASEQYALIRQLYEKRLLSRLPEELYSTARMRLDHPDMSLSQLAIHSVPPISKSGISHRMKKIMKTAAELLEKSK